MAAFDQDDRGINCFNFGDHPARVKSSSVPLSLLLKPTLQSECTVPSLPHPSSFQLLGSYLLQLRASLSYIGARRCSLFTTLFQLVFWEFLHVASTLLVSGVIYYRIFFWTFTSSTSCSALQCFGLWRLLSSQRHRLALVVVLLVIVS